MEGARHRRFLLAGDGNGCLARGERKPLHDGRSLRRPCRKRGRRSCSLAQFPLDKALLQKPERPNDRDARGLCGEFKVLAQAKARKTRGLILGAPAAII